MIVDACQRWRDRRERWVPVGPTIRAADFAVDGLADSAARAFVERHHYSGTFPPARFCAGLYRARQLVGAAVFSVSMNNRAGPAHTGLADAGASVELGRLVLLDDVAFNGETWFIARALRLLRQDKPSIESVLSYADPIARLNDDGSVAKPGHIGVIYQGMGAHYRGATGDRTEYHIGGRRVSGRALSKLRLGERGQDYAAAQLVAAGAPPRQPGEHPAAWVDRVVRRRRRTGNHAYVMPLTAAARAASEALPRLAYPRKGETA